MSFFPEQVQVQLRKIHFEFGIKHTFIFFLSFMLNQYLFKSTSVSLVSALITLFYLSIPNKNIKVHPILQFFYIYLNITLITFLGSLASLNLFWGLLLNLLVPFIIVCAYNTEANAKGYLFYYVMFIHMQFFSVSLDVFSTHLLSSFIGLAISYVFEEMIWSKGYKEIAFETVAFKDLIITRLKFTYLRFKDALDLDLPIFRFAIRLSVATVISCVLWKYLNLPKWYWISLSTCFTLVPLYDEVHSRAFHRVRSTFFGCILFLISSIFITDPRVSLAFTVFGVLMMLSYIPYKHLSEMYIFTTYIALSLSTSAFPSVTASIYRVSFVVTGTLIALILNHFLLPNKPVGVAKNHLQVANSLLVK